jgi:hypothetical protein
VGERIHIRGHTTDLVEMVSSMEIEHRKVDTPAPTPTAAPTLAPGGACDPN